MQIPALSAQGLNPATVGLGSAGRTDRAEAVELASASTTPVSAAAPVAPTAPPLRGTLQARDAQLNQRVAAAQQTLAYLDELGAQLDALKGAVSAQLADPTVQRPVDRLLQGVSSLWQQRQSSTLGSLDGQLRFNASGDARQQFQVRGLDRRSLQAEGREALSFTTGVSGPAEQRVLTTVLEAGQSEASRLRQLDHALAPAQIRVGQNAQGEVVLSTPQSHWPAVRDGLSIKGGGIRFPGQQFHRVKAEAQADAIDPSQWRNTDAAALRQTLQQVVPAQTLVRQSRAAVQSSLQDTLSQVPARPSAQDAAWAQRFARDFSAIGQQSPYAVFSSMAPAVQGISRLRVEALLKLPTTS